MAAFSLINRYGVFMLFPSLPSLDKAPLSVDIRRHGAVESSHYVDIAVVDGEGRIILGYGETERTVFPRSAMKPLQAIALIEQLQQNEHAPALSDDLICVTCASHNGQSAHLKAAGELLSTFDIDPSHLVCGAHWSLDQVSLIEQVRVADKLTKLHNNCSGKHAGMLVLAHLIGAPLSGYHRLEHPVQQRILGCLEAMTGCDLMSYPAGIDGCGAPALSGPLGNWARGFALFAGDTTLPKARQHACKRLAQSIAAAPHLIAGDRRLCSDVNQAMGSTVTVKVGAEGVYAGAFHEFGLGLMLKARDGAKRAAEQALLHVIQTLGINLPAQLAKSFCPPLTNWAGEVVGDIVIRNHD